jgi:hypothetical protein
MTVYVVQQPRPVVRHGRSTTYDLSPALQFGPLEIVFAQDDQPSMTPGPSLALARHKLKHIRPEDYLLWAGGDPAALSMVSLVAGQNLLGRIRLLRWERERLNGRRTGGGFYLPVEFRV